MDAEPARPLSRVARTLLALLAVASFAGLMFLGIWQLHRLSWKLDLIARTERMLAAAPVAAPGPADWPRIAPADAYRRVRVEGEFRHDLEACTQAVTERGPGCWVVTPLHTSDGWWLLVNRGFVEMQKRDATTRAEGQVAGSVSVEGLLRLTEPKGGFLRHNDLANNRWYSRDVAAIAAARGLPAREVAPYFVDAAATIEGGPIGGLTVVRFHNSHLVYALTWFGLALMVPFGAALVIRRERSLRQDSRA
ncbi:MAG: SURF1 family protein [Stagnimonas sp.]|nr:SURF1 family protein [Stagnimonas sp.]